jgi:hypothetical protein
MMRYISFWLSTIDSRRVIRVCLAMSGVIYDYIDGVVPNNIRWDADSLGSDWAAFYGLRFLFSEEETRVAGQTQRGFASLSHVLWRQSGAVGRYNSEP